MGDRTREIAAEALAKIAVLRVEDAIRRQREWEARQRNPINQAGRALHGVWRSIITGGWE